MKKTKMSLKLVSLLLLFTLLGNAIGCATPVNAINLMSDINANQVTAKNDLTDTNDEVINFALTLFNEANDNEKSTLVSPLSVLCALAMTTNGARDETLEQMESVFGLDIDDLNLYLYSYIKSLSQGDGFKLNLANSIWFIDNEEKLNVNKNFLQTNADYYNADAYKAPFNDQTITDINNWVKDKTNGLFDKVVDDIPPNAIMFLINALYFEAEWQSRYYADDVRTSVFTKEDGTKQSVEMMSSDEFAYLEDANTTGFVKNYKGGYSFVALLPNEGITIKDYVKSLTSEKLSSLFATEQLRMVYTGLPKFKTECEFNLVSTLSNMGMPNAFDVNLADFSGIGNSGLGNIYINKILHKTTIQVTEIGTIAGAVTSVLPDAGSVPDPKVVYLNRPFVYMIVDNANNVPFFIGTMMGVDL